MSPDWSKTTKYIILAIVLAAAIWGINYIRPMIGPLIISALLAYVLNPLVEWVSRHTNLRRNTGVLMVYLLFLTLLIAIPSSITPVIIRQVLRLSVDLLAVERQVEAFVSQPLLIGNLTISPLSQLTQNIDQLLQDFIRQVSSGAFNLLGNVTSNLVWVLVILVATYYFLKDSSKLVDWSIGLFSQDYQQDVEQLFHEMNLVWSAFLRGQLILALVIGVLTSIMMTAIGLRGAVGVGILAGVLDVIPSLGPLVAGVIAFLVALIFGSTYLPISNVLFAVLVLVIFLTIQQIENIWLRPQIMGQTLRLHPALIFIGVVGALALTGVLGALVIIPIMATLGIIGKYLRAKLLDEMPWPAPDNTPENEKPDSTLSQTQKEEMMS